MAKLTYHTAPVNAVSWSFDGDKIASAGDDKMIAIWKIDEKYDYLSEELPTFGEHMIFREKWFPLIKLRGPLAEISGIEWMNDDKNIIVSSLDGSIGFYNIKKQQQLLSIPINAQFIQGISIDHKTNNLLAVQSTSSTAKIFKIIKNKNKKKDKKTKKKKFNSVQFASLSYYPHSKKELEQQKIYNQQYKEEKKELEKMENTDNNNNTNNNKDNNNSKKPTKPKKKRIPKVALFKHNLITTSRKPHWSPDGVLLCMVAGQTKDKTNDCIHIFHRSNLTKKVNTFLLPESSHATVARFNPLKLKLNNNDIDKGSIVDQYNMKYRMLFAIICSSELFIFDTSKNNPVIYWKDQDTQNFFDMEWSFDGKSLLISDFEGFITHLTISDNDLVPFQ